MTKVPNDRLPRLALFPTGSVPKGRRDALETKLKERRDTVGNAISNGAVLALCVIFCLFYSGISILAWVNHAHPAFGVLFSILSAGTLVASGRCAVAFQEHYRKIVVVPERLRHEAEAEDAVAQAAVDVNIRAIFWNDVARSAVASDVSDVIVRALLAQRAAIERRQAEVADSLRRFNIATAPEPNVVRPTERWGPIETIDLTTRADS